MEQQNIPNRQDVYLTQAPNEEGNKDLKDAYNLKAARILGVVHIMCGLIAFSSEISMIENRNPCFISIGTGIWTSVFFFVSGGLAIRGAQSGNKFLVVATMVMSIISALSALVFVVLVTFLSSVFFAFFGQYHNSNYYLLLPIILGLLLVIVPTISASLTCQPLCCQKVVQPNLVNNHVHYQPNHVSQVHHQPNQAHYQPNQAFYQPNQTPYQPTQVKNHLNQPNQVKDMSIITLNRSTTRSTRSITCPTRPIINLVR